MPTLPADQDGAAKDGAVKDGAGVAGSSGPALPGAADGQPTLDQLQAMIAAMVGSPSAAPVPAPPGMPPAAVPTGVPVKEEAVAADAASEEAPSDEGSDPTITDGDKKTDTTSAGTDTLTASAGPPVANPSVMAMLAIANGPQAVPAGPAPAGDAPAKADPGPRSTAPSAQAAAAYGDREGVGAAPANPVEDTAVIACRLPGQAVADAVSASRSAQPRPAGLPAAFAALAGLVPSAAGHPQATPGQAGRSGPVKTAAAAEPAGMIGSAGQVTVRGRVAADPAPRTEPALNGDEPADAKADPAAGPTPATVDPSQVAATLGATDRTSGVAVAGAGASPVVALAPAEAMVTRHLDLAKDSAWLDGLAQDIVRSADTHGSLRFSLAPEHLGRLDVSMAQTADGTAIRLTTETREAHRIVSDAQPRLVAEARAQGLTLTEASVDLGSHSGGTPSQAFGNQNSGGGRQTQQAGWSPVPSAPAPANEGTAEPRGDDYLYA